MDDDNTVTKEDDINAAKAPQPINCGDPGQPGTDGIQLFECSYMGEGYNTYVSDLAKEADERLCEDSLARPS